MFEVAAKATPGQFAPATRAAVIRSGVNITVQDLFYLPQVVGEMNPRELATLRGALASALLVVNAQIEALAEELQRGGSHGD